MRRFGETPLGKVLSAPISLAALIATLVAAGVSPGSQPSVESIVTKHVQALGGIDRIHAIHSIILRGWYHPTAVKLPSMAIVWLSFMPHSKTASKKTSTLI